MCSCPARVQSHRTNVYACLLLCASWSQCSSSEQVCIAPCFCVACATFSAGSNLFPLMPSVFRISAMLCICATRHECNLRYACVCIFTICKVGSRTLCMRVRLTRCAHHVTSDRAAGQVRKLTSLQIPKMSQCRFVIMSQLCAARRGCIPRKCICSFCLHARSPHSACVHAHAYLMYMCHAPSA